MTKQYPIVQAGEYLYALDKETEIKEGQRGISINNATYTHQEHLGKNYRSLIIASNNLSLGLYLLPEIEEDIKTLALNKIKEAFGEKFEMRFSGDEKGKHDLEMAIAYFYAGYKAASSKKYTEEDIRKALTQGYDWSFEHETENETGFEEKDVQSFLKSLTPVPKAIEVEMCCGVKNPCDCSFQQIDCQVLVPKTKDNVVIVKQWIYE